MDHLGQSVVPAQSEQLRANGIGFAVVDTNTAT
jgi:hypothetical protein